VRHTETHARKAHGRAGDVNRLRRENARLREQLREAQASRKAKAGEDQTREQLSTSLLQAVLEAVADGIVAVDASGNVTTYNRKVLELWGLPESTFASRRFEMVLDAALAAAVHPDVCRARFIEIFSQPDMVSHDMVELKDGRILERYSLPQRLGEAIVGRVASYRDVTDRIKAERELRRSEELFKTVF
jgi:two-component system sensor histidine kinase/response regulator